MTRDTLHHLMVNGPVDCADIRSFCIAGNAAASIKISLTTNFSRSRFTYGNVGTQSRCNTAAEKTRQAVFEGTAALN